MQPIDALTLSLSYEQTVTNAGSNSDVPFTNPMSTQATIAEIGSYSQVDRSDFNIAITYDLSDWHRSLNSTYLVAGYLSGETEIQLASGNVSDGR